MEKVDLSKKTVMYIDNGVFVDMAVRLAEKFGKVYYYCEWKDSFPKMNKAYIGYGLENIETTLTIWDKIDEIDLFVFPDIYYSDLQNYLVSIGKRVWGMRGAEELENDRVYCKELMSDIGLPVGKYEVIKGIDNLRKYLKSNDDVFVKVSTWRGNFETFGSKNYKRVEPKLDEIEYNLGAFKHILEFVVEKALNDRVEIGSDMFVIDGQYPSKILAGIEIKDKSYLAMFKDYKDVPKEVTTFNKEIQPYLKEYGSRGFFSTEIRVGKDKKPYMTDFCSRNGSPPNELYQAMWDNLAEIVWYGSEGILVDPTSKYKFGAEVILHSSWADKNWQPITFPKEIRPYVKLRNACKIKNEYYVIPQAIGLPEIGAVIGFGNTKEEAIEHAKENARQVDGYYIECYEDSLDSAEEELKKTQDLGIELF